MSQLWNVLLGHMSLVGPRPNVESETDRYTEAEIDLLSVKPGITDISSIVFADEGEILQDRTDPDLDYNRLIRPWKSRLGLLYVQNWSPWLDIALIVLTGIAILSKKSALKGIAWILVKLDADPDLRAVAKREITLSPSAPPGGSHPVTAEDLHGTVATASSHREIL